MKTLVTGGAGFIGSHLVDALVAAGHEVRVLDDLFNGRPENLPAGAELVVGDVADFDLVQEVLEGVEVAFHQAALGSVRRSFDVPYMTNRINVQGTLAVLEGARRAGVRRVVFASSSSVYGGEAPLPTAEDAPIAPRSPYAVSKAAGEFYGRVFAQSLDVETVALRYFNVYGPRQRADSPYAAVIPLFLDALRRGEQPVIEGDGQQSRDFTFVADAVQANLRAAEAPAAVCSGRVYNVAGGRRVTILELLEAVAGVLGVGADPGFTVARPGDVRASQADLTAIRSDLGYEPSLDLEDGLRATIEVEEPT